MKSKRKPTKPRPPHKPPLVDILAPVKQTSEEESKQWHFGVNIRKCLAMAVFPGSKPEDWQ